MARWPEDPIMQWSDVIKPPPDRMLRQFAGLSLVIFGGIAAWRWYSGVVDGWTMGWAAAALLIGGIGLVAPRAIRPIYQGWMVVAFPIGWTVSKVVLGAMLYLVFTPVALAFRLLGRDALKLRPKQAASYWEPKATAKSGEEYLRQF
jgi:hypothetical protein